jgi:hypothetical protein
MKHLLVFLIYFGLSLLLLHIGYETGKVTERKKHTIFYDGEGNTLPDSAVKLMVQDHYVWISTAESTYLSHYALLEDTSDRMLRYITSCINSVGIEAAAKKTKSFKPLGDSAENKPLMPKK